MRLQHIDTLIYNYIFRSCAVWLGQTQHIDTCVLCEGVAMIGTQLYTLYEPRFYSLLFRYSLTIYQRAIYIPHYLCSVVVLS